MIRPGNPAPERPSWQQENGQPRPEEEEAPRQPSAAERARTLVESNPSLALAIPALRPAPAEPMVPLRCSVGPDGDVFLLFPRAAPAVRAARHASDDEVPAVLEVTDVAPVAVPHRIRGRAWVAGWLTHVPGGGFEADAELLRLEPGEISVDDLWGAALVEPDEFAAAGPDPLAPFETDVLQHLAGSHPEEVALLCGLVGEPCVAGATQAVPLALDRFGLRVRFTGAAGTYDARFDFPAPVEGPAAARRALRHLFASARA
ncbi:DUF2470 domain-containing protein [Streptomyces sp. CA2R106]|uniref:DUF2470 domain-containing protein n=1 Tax=Streptomyces sp. CA2R106 TaxID=3120153 RepID=UPI00300B8F15